MHHYTPLDAAIQMGGFDLEVGKNFSRKDVLDYFSEENLDRMFPGSYNREIDGYSLDECAEAIIYYLEVLRAKKIQNGE